MSTRQTLQNSDSCSGVLPRARLTYGIIAGGAALWCGAIVLAPVLAAMPGVPSWISELLYRFFQPVCHQLDARSFHLFGHPFTVCSRCAAIYLAFLAATLLYPFLYDIRRPAVPSRFMLIAAVIPMLADVGAGILGLHAITLVTRTVTGAFFGFIIPFFVIPAAIEGVGQLRAAGDSITSSQLQKGTPHA